jgi:hypothetical protein
MNRVLPLCLIPVLTACGAGNYQVYQIATASSTQSDGCYADGEVPEDLADDESTFSTGDTFVIFSAPEDAYYVQLSSGDSMPGTRDGKVYNFSAEVVDKEYESGANQSQELTTVVSSELKVTVDGRNVSGTSDTTVTFDCAGDNCPDGTECTTSSDFVGVRVDADIQYIAGASAN